MSKFKSKNDPFAEREAEKYENPIPSREFILEYLAERGKPATYEQAVEDLNLRSAEQLEALRRRLIAMARDGQLLKNRKGAYGPVASMEVIAGRVIGHKDGFGFVEPDLGGNDLFLSPREMRAVFHGDKVLVRVSSIDTRGRREAMIVEVLERNTQQITGRFRMESGIGYVESSNKRMTQDILIPLDDQGEATEGQMVVVAITAQPTNKTRALGKVVEILGEHMAPGMEINVAIRTHDLPYIFPENVLEDAARFKEVSEADIKGRKDYRNMPFVTIDGEDARDFDDAVYCVPREEGGWMLYVAIADVSHYVRPGTPLDKEAYKRGNSVYFPARVIPMLPEALSNNLCSLNPKVDRLVLVCEMTIQANGKISHHDFTEGVIHSHARLTYNQVHAMMEKNDRRMREQFKHIVPQLISLYDLFHVLTAARKKRGAIDFDMPETKIVYGKDRKIEKIVPYERFNSHKVIEECMLSANICAAQYLFNKSQPALYRVHQGPTEEKLADLRRFLNEMGIKMAANREPVPGDYAQILRAMKERPDFAMIQTVLLRSMSQAIYSPDNHGHFGLAYDAYAHFTSPIRRYPDLLVHRGIRHLITHKKAQLDDGALAKAGAHCSMTERRADDATNEVKDWLKCEFMMDKVGQEFEGRVSGVTSFGIFVELKDVYVEGLVHISTLPDDYYQFDASKHALMGERTGRMFRIGDSVKILVARVDLDQSQIDFVLAEGARGQLSRKSSHKEMGGRGKQNHSAAKRHDGSDKSQPGSQHEGGKRKKPKRKRHGADKLNEPRSKAEHAKQGASVNPHHRDSKPQREANPQHGEARRKPKHQPHGNDAHRSTPKQFDLTTAVKVKSVEAAKPVKPVKRSIISRTVDAIKSSFTKLSGKKAATKVKDDVAVDKPKTIHHEPKTDKAAVPNVASKPSRQRRPRNRKPKNAVKPAKASVSTVAVRSVKSTAPAKAATQSNVTKSTAVSAKAPKQAAGVVKTASSRVAPGGSTPKAVAKGASAKGAKGSAPKAAAKGTSAKAGAKSGAPKGVSANVVAKGNVSKAAAKGVKPKAAVKGKAPVAVAKGVASTSVKKSQAVVKPASSNPSKARTTTAKSPQKRKNNP